jgi:hypothetical protein
MAPPPISAEPGVTPAVIPIHPAGTA